MDIDHDDDGMWSRTPWETAAVASLHETEAGSLNGVLSKARATADAGRPVLLIVSSPGNGISDIDAGESHTVHRVLYVRRRTVLWGDATGWPHWGQGEGEEGEEVHGTTVGDTWWQLVKGVPTAGVAEAAASLPRRVGMGSPHALSFLLFTPARSHAVDAVPDHALDELTYLLAATGLAPEAYGGVSATWYGWSRGERRSLSMPDLGGVWHERAMRPLRMCHWQPLRSATPLPDEEITSACGPQCLAACQDLRQLAACLTADGKYDRKRLVPAGVVPDGFARLLTACGARSHEVRRHACRVFTVQCEAERWAEVAHSRALAVQLPAVGVYAPRLLSNVDCRSAVCYLCDSPCARLLIVKRDTAEGADVHGRITARARVLMKRRIPAAAVRAYCSALDERLEEAGCLACINCAQNVIARAWLEAQHTDATSERRRPARNGRNVLRINASDVRSAALDLRRSTSAQPSQPTWRGMRWCDPLDATWHPQGRQADLLRGTHFTDGGREWCVELVAPRDVAPFDFGVWAYRTDEWASAAEWLPARCEFFAGDFARSLAGAAGQAWFQTARAPARLYHAPWWNDVSAREVELRRIEHELVGHVRGDRFGADAVYCGRPVMGFSGCRPMGNPFPTTAVNTAADAALSFARNALLDDALCAYVHDRLSGRQARCWCRREGDGGHACHAALLIRVAHSDRAEMERLRQWARESMGELGEVAAAGERERWRSYRAANPVPATVGTGGGGGDDAVECGMCIGEDDGVAFGGAHGVGTDAGGHSSDAGVAATSGAGVSGTYDDGARDGRGGTSGTIDGGTVQSVNEQMDDAIDAGAPMSVDEQMSDAGAGSSGGGTLQGAIVKKRKNKGGDDKRRRQARAKAAAAVDGGAQR